MQRRAVARKNSENLPRGAGVYFLTDHKGEVFYIGKSDNIRSRVQTHMKRFGGDTARVGYIETADGIEALLEESRQIKKYTPKYNVEQKDDKKYFYVAVITPKGGLPYITLTHQRFARSGEARPPQYIGPFTEGRQLKTLLRYLRKIFPYYTSAKHSKLRCSYCHLDLCPGSTPDAKEYKKDIRRIVRILEGNRKLVERDLMREMKHAAKELRFEQAEKLKSILLALGRIFAHRQVLETKQNTVAKELGNLIGAHHPIYSIEGYDISNIQGREPVASMVRFEGGKPNKGLYRKFRIRLPERPNDTAMMREVIARRMAHSEWPLPDLFLIDGGKGQLNAALKGMEAADDAEQTFGQAVGVVSAPRLSRGVQRPLALGAKHHLRPIVISIAKRENELFVPGRKTSIKLETQAPTAVKNLLMHVRDESHRFAIAYHRSLHRKTFKN